MKEKNTLTFLIGPCLSGKSHQNKVSAGAPGFQTWGGAP